MNKDSLGDRIKKYEDAFRTYLPIRTPIILRIDGKSFHSYTKGCKKPFDDGLIECMNDTAIYLCKNIQGAKLSYVQSDEINILIYNPAFETQGWFENNLQKMVSVSASMASVIFTQNSWKILGFKEVYEGGDGYPITHPYLKPAFFDSRAFVVPLDEVVNTLEWRQQDCTRNSIQMLARSLYSHKQCDNKNMSQLQEMCFQKGHNWNNLPTSLKRGRCIVKASSEKEAFNPKTNETIKAIRSEWVIDNEIPIFHKNRSYIEKYINIQPKDLDWHLESDELKL